ncbi:MAG: ribose 5-phosphate isomerase B [Oscillospiraceae bacterium]|nr:ribose 5-phosphate isomerase B [Oscillospiraceae bacterium]
MKIAIGCDHAGYDLKKEVVKFLNEKNVEVIDCGCNGESCDYPDIAQKVCAEVTSDNVDRGVLICGTGIGMSIAANKVNGIRAAVCSEHFSVKYTRLHNDANVLCMGARVIGAGIALELTDIFISTQYEGGRHQRRLDLISNLEKQNN